MKVALAATIIAIALLLAFSGCIAPPEDGSEIPQPPAFPDSGEEDAAGNGDAGTIPQPPALPE